MNNIQKSYLANVKKALPTTRKVKRSYIDELSQSVEAYCREHTDVTYEEMCSVFGKPQDIAEAFLSERDGNEILKQKRHDRSRKIAVSVFALALICAVVRLSVSAVNSRALKTVYSNETVSVSSQRTVDLSAVSAQMSDTEQSEALLSGEITCISATKTITYYGKNSNEICRCTVTNEFVSPYGQGGYKTDGKPDVTVDIIDPEYSVEVGNVSYDGRTVNAVLVFRYKAYEEEKSISFSLDEVNTAQ